MTHSVYNDGSDNQTRISGGLRYTQYMGDGKFYGEMRHSGEMKTLEVGYE